jgi:16S rRNA (guanine527-N7)-methyltransferase
VTAAHTRAEQVREKFDFVVSRAVTRLANFYPWVANSFKKSDLPTKGLYYLKGGDLAEEIAESGLITRVYDLSNYFDEPFFETKKVVYVPLK